MQPFNTLSAVAAPLLRANVDTDAIIPSREMKTVSKSGLADGLFAGWRYTAIGGREPDRDFVLNQPRYAGARILLGGENFGCGSSREHAVLGACTSTVSARSSRRASRRSSSRTACATASCRCACRPRSSRASPRASTPTRRAGM